jgi:hypothetical protein
MTIIVYHIVPVIMQINKFLVTVLLNLCPAPPPPQTPIAYCCVAACNNQIFFSQCDITSLVATVLWSGCPTLASFSDWLSRKTIRWIFN